MIRTTVLLSIFTLLPVTGFSQSLTVSASGNTANNSASTFRLEGGNVSIEDDRIRFWNGGVSAYSFLSYGVSPDRSLLALVSRGDGTGRAVLVDAGGDTLSSFPVTGFSADDPSVAVYPENTGGSIVRDNIANFNFYDSFGNLSENLSDSGNGDGEEVVSELARDPEGRTLVLYTPKIRRGDKLGSRVRVAGLDRGNEQIYASDERFIKHLEVSADGQFVSMVTARRGSEDQILVMDRYGNRLGEIGSGASLQGAVVSEAGAYVTAYSGRRIVVYEMISGERIGSTSFNSPVVRVDYFPRDEVILVMTGSGGSDRDTLSEVEFHAISLAQQKVERSEYSEALGIREAIDRRFVRTGSNRYRLVGASRILNLQVSF